MTEVGEQQRVVADLASALDDVMRRRRDVRRFRRASVDEPTVSEVVAAAGFAPSVGLSEPTRLVRLVSATTRQAAVSNFEAANKQALAGYEGARAELYASLKLAGLADAPVVFAVFSDVETTKGSGLGRQTIPDTLVYSSVCAVMLMWLAATARGLGLGWVSILDPEELAASVDAPPAWVFIGCVCIGWPETYDRTPELERAGWESRSPHGPVVIER